MALTVPTPLDPVLPADLEAVDASSLAGEGDWTRLEVRGELTAPPDSLDVEECRLLGLSLTLTELARLRMTDVVVTDGDWSGVALDEADLLRVTFRGCRLRGLSAPRARLRDVRFEDCTLDEASLRLASGERVVFEGCSMREADLYGIELSDSALLRCDLRRAELSAARLPGALLHGSRLEDLRGVAGLRDVSIDSAQVPVLALEVFAGLGIVVDDDLGAR